METIDLRSDTVTKPSPGMRQAMSEAEVGDDVFGDDPTVNRLEEMVATMFGKEAALYVPSGTMGNQSCLYTATTRGDEILCERGCHIVNYEVAAPAALSGLLTTLIDGHYGKLSAEQIEAHIRPVNLHCPRTRVVALENTHNRAGGTVYTVDEIKPIHDVARKHELWMHLDGARIWNAHVLTGTPLSSYAKYFDSISVCLSKGLGAPVGSVAIGTREFIDRARRTRKLFGGGMRQAGVIAAAGIYALENNIARLAEDHDNARFLAESLNDLPGLTVDLNTVQTNIVLVDLDPQRLSVDNFTQALRQKGILCIPFGPARVRFVTHLDVNRKDCEKAVRVVREVVNA